MEVYVVTEEYYWDYQQYVSVFATRQEARDYLTKVRERTNEQIHWRDRPDVYDFEDVTRDEPFEFRIDGCCDIKIWKRKIGDAPFPEWRYMFGRDGYFNW